MDIFKAESLGVTFFISVETPAGANTISLDSSQLIKLEKDPDAFKAALFGLSVSEYYLWLEHKGAVICSGTTASGKRCKNAVAGGIQLTPSTWKERQGEYCVIHSGPQKE